MSVVSEADLEVLRALVVRVSGDASGVALSREVREQMGGGALAIQTVTTALGRLEDAGLVTTAGRNGMPRGQGSGQRLWAPTSAGWEAVS